MLMLSSPTPRTHQGERVKLPCITRLPEEGGGDTLQTSLTQAYPANPKLSDLQTQQLFKFKRKQAAATEDVVYHERQAEELSTSLQTVQQSIERIHTEQLLLQKRINQAKDKEQIECLLQIKCKQHQELLDCLQLEDQFMNDLACAQRLVRQSHLNKRTLYDELTNSQVDQLNAVYNSRKTRNFQNRMHREGLHEQVVQKSKFQAMKNYVTTVLAKKLQEHDDHSAERTQTTANKEARNKLQYHIRNAQSRRRRLDEESQAGQRMIQIHRHKALTLLKKQINQQRLELQAKRDLKIRHDAIRQNKLESEIQRFYPHADNPYLVKELLKAQSKLKKAQEEKYLKKLMDINRLKDEYLRREHTLQKEARQREKWNQFWKQKLKEKKRQHYNTFVKPFLAASPRKFSKSNRWLRVLQENYPRQAQLPQGCAVTEAAKEKLDKTTTEISGTSDEQDSKSSGKTVKNKTKSVKSRKKTKSPNHSTEESSTETDNLTEDSATNNEKIPGYKTKKKSKKSRKKGKNLSDSEAQTSDSAPKDEKAEKSGKNPKKSTTRSRKKDKQSGESKQNSPSAQSSEQSDSSQGKKSERRKRKSRKKKRSNKNKSRSRSKNRKHHHKHNPTEKAPSSVATQDSEIPQSSTETKAKRTPPALNTALLPWPSATIPLDLAQLACAQFHSEKATSPPTDVAPYVLSYPPVLHFSNFQVGKTYNVRVSLKNNSKKRLKFTFKEVTEEEMTITGPANPPPTPAESIKDGESSQPDSTRSAPETAQTEPKELFPDRRKNRKGRSKKQKSPKTSSKVKRSKSPRKPKSSPTSKKGKRNKSPMKEAPFPHDPPATSTPPTEEKLDKLKLPKYKPSDLIQVHFTIPPLISPGLQHTFRVTFTPKAQQDWDGDLTFVSEYGLFKIPVQIRKKRFIPQIQIPPGVFIFPPTILGSSVVKRIKIKNIGGLAGQLLAINEPNPPKMFDHDDDHLQPDPPPTDTSAQTDPLSSPSSPKFKGRKGKKSPKSPRKKSPKSPRKKSPKTPTKTPSGRQKDTQKKKTVKQKAESSELKVKTAVASKSQSETIVEDFLDSLIDRVGRNVFVSYVQDESRIMDPGQSLTLVIIFRPPFVNKFHTTYKLHFEGQAGDTDIDQQQIQVEATGLDIPLQLSPRNSDFKICILNNSYQVRVSASLRKLHKNAHVKAIIPADIKPFVNIHPAEGMTISPMSPGNFTVRFTPRESILQNPKKFSSFFDPITNILDFPINFQAKLHNSLLSSLSATFMAVLTKSLLEVTPRTIHLGLCLTTETVKSAIAIRNPTSIVQKFGFIEIPDDFLVQPNYGFGFVSPGETVFVDLLFSPETVPEGPTRSQSFTLKLVTILGDQYPIQVKAIVKSCAVKLTPTSIYFPATPCGSYSMAYATLKNLYQPTKLGGKQAVTFVVDLLQADNVQILPNRGILEYCEEARLILLYVASVSDEDVRTCYVEQSRQKYLLQMDSLQRELQAIDFHIENDWMLHENSLPDIPRTHLLTSQISLTLPERQHKLSPHSKDDGELKSRSKNKNRKASKSPKGSKRSKSPEGKSSKSPEGKSSKSPKGSKKGSPSPEKFTKSKKTKKKPDLTPKQAFLNELKARKEYIKEKLNQPFVQPDASKLLPGSLEFSKAKRELLKHCVPVSKSIRLPIRIYYPDNTQHVLYLQLKCAIQKPDLILVDDNAVFDFGSTPVHAKTWREISVLNLSQVTLTLKCDLLNPHGPFVHVNALRPLAPDHVYVFRIYCSPKEIREYAEEFVIFGGESKIMVLLKARGAPPPTPPKSQTPDSPKKKQKGSSKNSSKKSSKKGSKKRKKKNKKKNKSPTST